MSAKQHRLLNKSNQPSVWPIAILEGETGIVLFTHGGKSLCGEKVHMWRMMIGWHIFFQAASCIVIMIWLVS